jgi:hypothetical protein
MILTIKPTLRQCIKWVARISKPVAITVFLIGVCNIRAIIALVPDPIAIAIRLIRVHNIWTVVSHHKIFRRNAITIHALKALRAQRGLSTTRPISISVCNCTQASYTLKSLIALRRGIATRTAHNTDSGRHNRTAARSYFSTARTTRRHFPA